MIISGAIDLDVTTHAAATAALRDRLGVLDERRRAAERSVETVLAAWHGEAADAFRGRWAEWSSAAAQVVDDLAVGAQALDLARADLTSADALSRVAADRLGGRLR